MAMPTAKMREAPSPFPGKYPTRIGMIVQWRTREGEERSWRYSGKPSRIAVKKFYKSLSHAGIILYCYLEWDRKWKIVHAMQEFRPYSNAPVHVTQQGMASIWLWCVYHPWTAVEHAVGRWLSEYSSQVHNISRTGAEGRGSRIYAPFKTLGLDRVRQYRVLIVPPEKKPTPSPTPQRGADGWLHFVR